MYYFIVHSVSANGSEKKLLEKLKLVVQHKYSNQYVKRNLRVTYLTIPCCRGALLTSGLGIYVYTYRAVLRFEANGNVNSMSTRPFSLPEGILSVNSPLFILQYIKSPSKSLESVI